MARVPTMSGVFLRRSATLAVPAAVGALQLSHAHGRAEPQSSWTLIEESELALSARDDFHAVEHPYSLRDVDANSMTVATGDSFVALGAPSPPDMRRPHSTAEGDVEILKREVQDLKRQIRILLDARVSPAPDAGADDGPLVAAAGAGGAPANERCVAAAVALGALCATLCVQRRPTNADGFLKHAPGVCGALHKVAAAGCCFRARDEFPGDAAVARA